VLAAQSVWAFTMGEQLATTGIQGSLAATGSRSVSGTINSVKGSLAASAPTLPTLSSGGIGRSGPGVGAPGRPHSSSSNSGWGGASQGWAKQGDGKGSWVGSASSGRGGWAAANAWSGQGKAWSSSAQGGGGWARPGSKS